MWCETLTRDVPTCPCLRSLSQRTSSLLSVHTRPQLPSEDCSFSLSLPLSTCSPAWGCCPPTGDRKPSSPPSGKYCPLNAQPRPACCSEPHARAAQDSEFPNIPFSQGSLPTITPWELLLLVALLPFELQNFLLREVGSERAAYFGDKLQSQENRKVFLLKSVAVLDLGGQQSPGSAGSPQGRLPPRLPTQASGQVAKQSVAAGRGKAPSLSRRPGMSRCRHL